MDQPLENYWGIRMAELKTALEANNFEVHLAADSAAAHAIVMDEILPKTGARSVGFGGSLTAVGAGLFQTFKGPPTSPCSTPWTSRSPSRSRWSGAANRCWSTSSSRAPMPSPKTASSSTST